MPALVDFTRAAKGLCRSHIVYAHVWALVVIEVYGFGNGCHHLADIREPHVLEQLILHRVVDPFGLRIVLGITVLGHCSFLILEFFLPIYVFIFSVTLSSSLTVRELRWFYLFRAVINSHAAVISVTGKEALPNLIEVYCRTGRV